MYPTWVSKSLVPTHLVTRGRLHISLQVEKSMTRWYASGSLLKFWETSSTPIAFNNSIMHLT